MNKWMNNTTHNKTVARSEVLGYVRKTSFTEYAFLSL